MELWTCTGMLVLLMFWRMNRSRWIFLINKTNRYIPKSPLFICLPLSASFSPFPLFVGHLAFATRHPFFPINPFLLGSSTSPIFLQSAQLLHSSQCSWWWCCCWSTPISAPSSSRCCSSLLLSHQPPLLLESAGSPRRHVKSFYCVCTLTICIFLFNGFYGEDKGFNY